MEKEESAGTSYWDCLKGVNLRRTEIVCVVWLIQNICGSTFMGYSTNFYEQAGLAITDSFDMSMGQYTIGAVGTFLSWFVVGFAGRRTIYLWGLVALGTILFVIGFISLAHPQPVARLGHQLHARDLHLHLRHDRRPRSATRWSGSCRRPVCAESPSCWPATSTTSPASSSTSSPTIS